MKYYDPHDDPDNHEKFTGRKRNKKQGKGASDKRAMRKELAVMQQKGYFEQVVSELRSGKEATVFIVSRQDAQGESFAIAKVYKSLESRGFQRDERYTQGRWIADKRLERAIGKGSSTGKAAQQAMWVAHEYHQMWELYDAGLAVPKPLIGPSHDEIAETGRIVLMELIGEGAAPAPRLSDLRFTDEEKAEVLRQCLELLRGFYRLKLVHGDFSAYNLLWHQQRVIAIDFPQMVKLDENPEAHVLLQQDVESLITSLGLHKVEPDALLTDITKIAD